MAAGQVRTAVQTRKAPEVNTMHRLPGTQENYRAVILQRHYARNRATPPK